MAKQPNFAVVMLTCRITRPLDLAINLAAKKANLTRSQLIRQALIIAIDAIREAA